MNVGTQRGHDDGTTSSAVFGRELYEGSSSSVMNKGSYNNPQLTKDRPQEQ